jgi:cysteine synthase A
MSTSAENDSAKGPVVEDVLELIGRTPLVRLGRVVEPGWAEIWGKLEHYNPGGSVKDRIALSMIEDAESRGLLKPGGTIVEPTSGNTGIGLALVALRKGYRLIITMPEGLNVERNFLLRSLDAEIVLTPASEGMAGAVRRAKEIVAGNPSAFLPQQFDNPANPGIHRRTTGEEIWAQTEGQVDALVAGIGTGGTITGAGELLKERNPALLVIGVEPASNPLLGRGRIGPHLIQGIGANFIPAILNRELLDEVIAVSDDDAFRTARLLARREGLLVGVSSGAAAFACFQVAKRLGAGKRVVVILPDGAERYHSLEAYFEGRAWPSRVRGEGLAISTERQGR